MRWGRIFVYAAVLFVLKAAWGFLAATYAVGPLSRLLPAVLAAMSFLGLVGGAIAVAVLGEMAYRTSEGVLPALVSVLLAALISSVAGVLTTSCWSSGWRRSRPWPGRGVCF